MDLDEEILQRLTNTEDHFTERKSAPHHDDCKEAIIAFANSALPNKPGILYVGVNNAGDILHNGAPESWQDKIGKWAKECYPLIEIIPRSLSKAGRPFLAVVVPLSPLRPHFLGPAYKRAPGPATVPASQQEIDEWIAYRNSKVRLILDQKGKLVSVAVVQPAGIDIRIFQGMIKNGEYRVVTCNPHFVTLTNEGGHILYSEPLSGVDFKWNHSTDRLVLLLKPYV